MLEEGRGVKEEGRAKRGLGVKCVKKQTNKQTETKQKKVPKNLKESQISKNLEFTNKKK